MNLNDIYKNKQKRGVKMTQIKGKLKSDKNDLIANLIESSNKHCNSLQKLSDGLARDGFNILSIRVKNLMPDLVAALIARKGTK